MPSPASRPVAVVLGLVPTVLGGALRLPGKAVQLPIYAVSHALTSIGAARQGYDDLAERGERLIARLRGTSFDEVEDRVEDALRGTPLAGVYEKAEDAVEDAAEKVTSIARAATSKATSAPRSAPASAATPAPRKAATHTPDAEAAAKAVEKAQRALAEAAERAEQAAAEAAEKAAAAGLDPEQAERERKNPAQAGKGRPTPKAGKGKAAKQDAPADTAAAPAVVEAVEKVSAQVGGVVLEHDQLPLPDYDHLTLGSLRGRMRSLDLPQLVQIRDYEKAHGDRLPIVTMLDNRIARLVNDPTAPLSGSDPAQAGAAPDKAPASTPAASKVEAKTADTAASTPDVAFGGLGSSQPGSS